MGFNSVSYLVVPRVLAGLLICTVFYVAASVFGIAGGLVAGVLTNAVPAAEYIKGAQSFFAPWNVLFGFVKSFVFGFVITSIACYKGYYASGAAEGVGKIGRAHV